MAARKRTNNRTLRGATTYPDEYEYYKVLPLSPPRRNRPGQVTSRPLSRRLRVRVLVQECGRRMTPSRIRTAA
eukprot:scaffold250775_cov24-Prasinocladus_malaysianus.AAC.1